MQRTSPIRIGTRASRLAQVQARWTQAAITAALGAPPGAADDVAPLILISTAGDRIQDRRLLEVGGKALFTKEIEQALLDGRIDCAVHSLKDVPAEPTPGLVLAAHPEREDVRDAFVSPRFACFEALPQGARLGTASLRRQAQALHRRPDLQVVMLRGNVETRLRKLDDGEVDATLLALAGLNRLGLQDRIGEAFDPVAIPPAPGQGALAIQTRADDAGPPGCRPCAMRRPPSRWPPNGARWRRWRVPAAQPWAPTRAWTAGRCTWWWRLWRPTEPAAGAKPANWRRPMKRLRTRSASSSG